MARQLFPETVIVTDKVPRFRGEIFSVAEVLLRHRLTSFLPNAKKLKPSDNWWNLSPKLVEEFLQILGFPHTKITSHRQKYQDKVIQLYTVVGQRK